MRARAVRSSLLSFASVVLAAGSAAAQTPQAPAPPAAAGSVGAVGRKEVTGSTSTLETAPSPVQAGTSVAAPGLPPLPPPYPETTEPVDPGKVTPAEGEAEKDDDGDDDADDKKHKGHRHKRPRGPSASLENWLSFRYGSYRLTGSDRDRTADSFQAAFAYDSATNVLGGSTKFSLAGAIGSGGGQPDGLIQGQLLFGLRTNPSGTSGALARLGIAGSYTANANWLRSWLELPRGELGYQLLDKHAFVELTAHAGASLTGRFDPGATLFRSTPVTLAWGGTGTVQLDPIRFTVDYTRTEPGGVAPNTPLDEVAGNLCAEAFSAILLCGEAAQTWGDVQDASGVAYTVKALRIGFTVGFGALAHRSAADKLQPKRKPDGDD